MFSRHLSDKTVFITAVTYDRPTTGADAWKNLLQNVVEIVTIFRKICFVLTISRWYCWLNYDANAEIGIFAQAGLALSVSVSVLWDHIQAWNVIFRVAFLLAGLDVSTGDSYLVCWILTCK